MERTNDKSIELTAKEYAYILDDSRARVLIVFENLLPQIEEIHADRQFLEHDHRQPEQEHEHVRPLQLPGLHGVETHRRHPTSASR